MISHGVAESGDAVFEVQHRRIMRYEPRGGKREEHILSPLPRYLFEHGWMLYVVDGVVGRSDGHVYGRLLLLQGYFRPAQTLGRNVHVATTHIRSRTVLLGSSATPQYSASVV